MAIEAVQEQRRGVAWYDIEKVVNAATPNGSVALEKFKTLASDIANDLIVPGSSPLYMASVVIRRQCIVDAME